MKKYENPIMDVISVEETDVIRTSDKGDEGPNVPANWQ